MSRHSARGTRWQTQRRRILERDGWQCAYCQTPLVDGQSTGNGATVDHVDPIALDPGHDYHDDELVACCRSCNAAKGDRQLIRHEWFDPRWFPHGRPC